MRKTTGKRVRRSKGKRGKPTVATSNQERAKDNLEYKAVVLESWVEHGFPQSLIQLSDSLEPNEKNSPSSFPRSIRQFNHWQLEASKAHIIGISRPIFRNSNDTLSQYPKLRERIDGAIKMLKVAWDSQGRKPNEDRKLRLQNLLRISEGKREALESELIDVKRSLSSATRARDIALASLADLKREFRGEIERYRSGMGAEGVAPAKAGVVKINRSRDREPE
jgi:hypothetical protein